MKPSTAIATALALGAVHLKADGDAALVRAYIRLKHHIVRRYPSVSLAGLEEAPRSEAQREALEKGLVEAGTDRDEDVLRQAKELLRVIQTWFADRLASENHLECRADVQPPVDIEAIQAREWRSQIRRLEREALVREQAESAHATSVASGNDSDVAADGALAGSGYLAYNPPNRMRVGRSETIEARVARDVLPQLISGMRGRGEPKVEGTPVAALMWTELDGSSEAFGIEGNRERPQWLDGTARGYASWSWRVTPRRAGTQVLTLRLLGHKIAADGHVGELAFDPVERHIQVRVNPARALRRVAAWVIPLGAAAMLGALAEDGARAVKQHLLAWPEAGSTTPPPASAQEAAGARE